MFTRRFGPALLAGLLVLVWTATAGGQGGPPALDRKKPCRGVAVLSSVVGRDATLAELRAVVRECKLDLVVIDFAWITHHWARTDLGAVEKLASELKRAGVTVAAMYRARALRPQGVKAHFAHNADGSIAEHHNDLCLAHADSVDWGAAWGTEILAACPSVDRIILYNVRATCACTRCRGGRGAKHVAAFLKACRTRWNKVRPGVRIGHVGIGLEHGAHLDFFSPFLSVNRGRDSQPVNTEALVKQARVLVERAGSKAVVPLAKICWASATRNTTEDVVNTIRSAAKHRLGFILWYYGWIFRPDRDRYDPAAVVGALGGDWQRLKRFFGKRPPANGPRWWVYFTSRESREGKPPTLVVHCGQRTSKIAATADAPIIEYLADRSYGRMARLSVGTRDKNRSLIRFELPKSLTLKSVTRAELVLDLRMSKQPPRAPIELAVHAVEAAWKEGTVSWAKKPRIAIEPALVVEVAPRAAMLRWDVTALVRGWLADRKTNHGILVKQTGAVVGSAEGLFATLPWMTDVEAALKKARAEKRLVLTCVRGAFAPAKENLPEKLLMAVAFADPTVVDLVKHRFVPLRVSYKPSLFTFGRARGGTDPLKPLGGDATKIKALALMVSTPTGKLVAKLDSIGTFDAEVVYRFLRRALAGRGKYSAPRGDTAEALLAAGALDAARDAFAKERSAEKEYGRARIAARRGDHAQAVRLAHGVANGGSTRAADARVQGAVSLMRQGDFDRATQLFREALKVEPAPGRADEALYYLGCLEQLAGDWTHAEATFARLKKAHPKSLWTLKANARLAWPHHIVPAENLRSIPGEIRRLGGTERAVKAAARSALIGRAVRYLIELQREDGAWPVEHEMYRSAVTALIAKALWTWAPLVEKPLRKRADAASVRALDWIKAHLDATDPKTANSWGAAYLLDYLLVRSSPSRTGGDQDRALAATVAKAVDFLLGGQCPNGAWSYSQQFDAGWRGGFGGWPKTTRGRVHSVNTGPALLVLARAKRRGFQVNAKAVARAVKVLKDMREGPGIYTYTYPMPLNFRKPDQSIARGPVCEHALFAAGAVSRKSLLATVRRFMKVRQGLRIPVKLNSSWGNPHAFSSYFFFFAYYHAALAIEALGKQTAAPLLKQLHDDLLLVPEMDATWVDYHAVGKPYGTAMALLVLAMNAG